MMKSIICIGREYGSGGREVGERLSKILNIPYYDKMLLKKVVEHFGVDEERLKSADEKPVELTGIVSGNVFADMAGFTNMFYFDNMNMFGYQKETIERLADEGPCIIIGRCASSILKDRDDVLSVFIYADEDERIKRIMERNNVDSKIAKKRMKDIDTCRANYQNFYTDDKWGKRGSYDIMISTSKLGVAGAVRVIEAAIK